ncbi:MAG: PolC-type DNA polymerase III, partial [Ruminococcaceae bacterium]|nr:PolC-type DNA polymerase III [Oscillospiraceae bacterium]
DVNTLPSHHMILLAQNRKGLFNLYTLITKSHMDYFYKTPRIPKSELVRHREGLLVGSACEAGELFRAMVADESEANLMKIAGFYDYLEIQPLGNNRFMVANGTADEEQLREYNRRIIALGDKLGKPVVATGDVHFLNKEDEVFRRILMAAKGFDDADNQAPLYFRTTNEMLEEFGYLGDELARKVVIENPNAIAEMIESIPPVPKEKCPPEIEGSDTDIMRMSKEKAERIYGSPLPEIVQKRMDKELDSIISNGFAVMYLIAHKLVKKSNEDGYLVGSRGSVGSSFVAFLSDITEINALPPHYVCPECKYSEFKEGEAISGCDLPDKSCPKCGTPLYKDGHDIPFETFLGFDGDKAPDIDLNFSGDYQGIAHKYTEVLFGAENVYKAGTIGTLAEKTAYGHVRKYFEERGKTLRKAELDRLTLGCTGVKRTTGQHPGGIVVLPKGRDINEFCPVQHPADKSDSDVKTTHFDYHSIDENLLKLDILGHDDPTVIRMLEDLTGLDAKKIPLDDKETMSLFTGKEALKLKEDIKSTVGTLAIPEFGTGFVRQMLVDTKPKTFSDLIRISGLSHGTDVWLGNAQDIVKSGTASLSGCICTRDDIMLYLITKGVAPKLSFTVMEAVRKGKGLKPDWEEEMRAHDVPAWYIDSCNKIQYMFPKAHAAAYVTMAFRIAYCKVHYPLAFYMAYYSVRADDFDYTLMANGHTVVKEKMKELSALENKTQKDKNVLSILEVCDEMYARGFSFCPIDLYESAADKFREVDGRILPPLTSMQGLGAAAAHSIAEARKAGPFLSVDDLVQRSGANKAVVEIMMKSGVLNDLPQISQTTLFGI